MKKMLVVDDDPGTRESLRTIFSREYNVILTENAAQALGALAVQSVDLVLLDVIMPDKDGVTFLRELSDMHPDLPVVMISASDQVRSVVESMKSGAVDFVTKPFDVQELRQLVGRVLHQHTLQRKVRAMESDLSRQFPLDGMIGQSDDFLAAMELARRAALTDATVLIEGESGTGKEMVARQIHRWSSRSEEPFVAVHCGALPETLMESELFGHEKGAFTNADRQKPGRFDLAGSGTLFFDEISEMTPATQMKLLRVLQEREYMRVGGTRVLRTNARILAATNRDLVKAMTAGDFREDLYYRLNVVPVSVPPLRQRREDIPLLAKFFLESFRAGLKMRARGFAPDTLDALCAYNWPGNIRELRNVIERMVVLHGDHEVFPLKSLPKEFHRSALRPELPPEILQANLADAVDRIEKEMVMDALRRCDGVQTRAASMLGITRRVLKYKMDKFGLGSEETPS
ncbi:MAG: sigma-54-dependent Fis family transcriptional regulator [Verrucomicrobia bacterium]|nr:sigma-54-dependent Fis family transcriptional regulator [Verrucomicrobiota bacterium]MCH8511552.1 sigma-54 dependent transcriptional regulator [Kiritimatiellia bacterium]